jgi:hypothetical protein
MILGRIAPAPRVWPRHSFLRSGADSSTGCQTFRDPCIEVQSGDDLGEDDIVRLDDVYGRQAEGVE